MGALGGSGAGSIAIFDGVEFTFMPWTQGMMDAFESWLVGRLRLESLDTAAECRKKARKLYAQARPLIERGLSDGDDGPRMGVAQVAQLQEDKDDLVGEAQALDLEARIMVNQISEQKAAGYYHFFGELASKSRNQVYGRVKIAHLMLAQQHPGITLVSVEKIALKHWTELGDAITEANEEKKPVAPTPADSTPPNPTTTSASPSTDAGATTTS